MKYKKRTIIHLGAHKTGTTLIQNWIAQNYELFAERSIGITRNADLAEGSFSRFCLEYSKPYPKTTSPESAKNDIAQKKEMIGNPDIHIISKENILGEAGRLYINSEDTIRVLKNIVDYDNTTLVFYIRRMDTFIESHILQQFAHGHELKVEDALRSIGNRTWMDVVDSLETHFPGKLTIEFYEKSKAGTRQFLQYFCNACGIPSELADITTVPDTKDQNRSISSSGIAILKDQWGGLDKNQRIELFETITRTHHTGRGDRPLLLTEEQRREILSQHRDSHETLIKKYAPESKSILRHYTF